MLTLLLLFCFDRIFCYISLATEEDPRWGRNIWLLFETSVLLFVHLPFRILFYFFFLRSTRGHSTHLSYIYTYIPADHFFRRTKYPVAPDQCNRLCGIYMLQADYFLSVMCSAKNNFTSLENSNLQFTTKCITNSPVEISCLH